MPRTRRSVFPGVPHHVTQRGNHRDRVFFDAADADAYRCLLQIYFNQHGVETVAYCLMPNHVHLVVVPSNYEGIHRALRAVHSQFAQRINRMRKTKGHLWQGRYFSSPLDAAYFRNAVRYVELNPVRARIVDRAEDYAWSSAAAHCGYRYDLLITRNARPHALSDIADWSAWLAQGLDHQLVETLRNRASRNLPCGTDDFVEALGRSTGCELRYRKRGGQPGKRKNEGARPLR